LSREFVNHPTPFENIVFYKAYLQASEPTSPNAMKVRFIPLLIGGRSWRMECFLVSALKPWQPQKRKKTFAAHSLFVHYTNWDCIQICLIKWVFCLVISFSECVFFCDSRTTLHGRGSLNSSTKKQINGHR
jgi:hypothetical protein